VPRSTSPWYPTAAPFGTKRRAFDSGIVSLLAYSDYKSAVLSRLISRGA
jgi:hypothetical protein